MPMDKHLQFNIYKYILWTQSINSKRYPFLGLGLFKINIRFKRDDIICVSVWERGRERESDETSYEYSIRIYYITIGTCLWVVCRPIYRTWRTHAKKCNQMWSLNERMCTWRLEVGLALFMLIANIYISLADLFIDSNHQIAIITPY